MRQMANHKMKNLSPGRFMLAVAVQTSEFRHISGTVASCPGLRSAGTGAASVALQDTIVRSKNNRKNMMLCLNIGRSMLFSVHCEAAARVVNGTEKCDDRRPVAVVVTAATRAAGASWPKLQIGVRPRQRRPFSENGRIFDSDDSTGGFLASNGVAAFRRCGAAGVANNWSTRRCGRLGWTSIRLHRRQNPAAQTCVGSK